MKTFIFIFLSFIKLFYSNKTILLNTRLISSPFFNITLNETEIEVIYTTMNTLTDLKMIFTPFENATGEYKNKCYKSDKSKYQNKNGTIYIYKEEKFEGPIYKDNISINGVNLKENEFIYMKFDACGVIFFDQQYLAYLKDKNYISNKIISYSKIDSFKRMNITIGEKYNITNLFNYDICNMKKGIYGCNLNKIAVSNTIEDFKNGKNISFYIFDNITVTAEFFFGFNIENLIFIPTNITLIIIKFLEKNKFICKENIFGYDCKSNNSVLFFIFGKKGIKFNNISIWSSNEIDNIYFCYQTIPNLQIILDVEDNKVIFHSNSNDILFDYIKSDSHESSIFEKWWFWVIVIFIIIIILCVGFYFFICKKNNPEVLEKLVP